MTKRYAVNKEEMKKDKKEIEAEDVMSKEELYA